LLIFSFKKINAKTAVQIGQVKNIQLAVETGIYLTAVTYPIYPINPQIDLNKIIE
jgi:hypothetical protein